MNAIGRYEVFKEIGRGAMGIVFLGRDPKIDRPVAIKCVRPHPTEEQEETRARFQRETLALGRLIHPNIVSIFDAGKDPVTEREFIVMEYVEGVSLAELLKRGEILSSDQIRSIGIQVCHALDFAHSKGVIHRDIKPGNILLSPDLSTAKVTDFGIARLDRSSQVQTDRLLGTPQYMSPEQCKGGVLDGRSDLFAVGALLYELITLQKPFPGENMTVIIHSVLTKTPPAPTAISPEIPEQLSKVVMKALEKDPDQRFSSGKEMAGALFFELTRKPFGREEGATLRLAQTEEKGPVFFLFPIRPIWILAAIFLAIAGIFGWFTLNTPLKSKASALAAVRQGKIALSTHPSGAEILINGQRRGTSPLTIELPAGSHELEVKKAGHDPLEATINVQPGEEVPIDLKLSKEEVSR